LVIGKPWFIYFSWDSEKSEVRWDRVATFVKGFREERLGVYFEVYIGYRPWPVLQ